MKRFAFACLLVGVSSCGRQDSTPLAVTPAAEPTVEVFETIGTETLTAAAALSDAANWPNWLGPRHDGIATVETLATAWPAEGLPLVWSREIGIGFSSLSIVDGRAYTMGHVDGMECVYCLNADSGEIYWKHESPAKLLPNLHEGGPAATPTVDGERVYTLGKEGQLFCFTADAGEIKWQKNLLADLDVRLPEWGFSSSPYVLDDQLILQGGRVVSYDKHTGDKNWQTEKHRAGYGSAAVFERAGVTLLATLDCDGLRVLWADNGAEVSFAEWDSPFRTNSTTPIVDDGKIYISTGYNVGCGLFAFDGDSELELVYANREMRNHFNNSILFNGFLYGFDGNSNLGRVVQLTCQDIQTGEVMWQERGFGCGSLMIVNGQLLILSEDGTLVLAAASTDAYEELARSPLLTGRCWTIPVVYRNRVYARNAAGRLVCAQLP